MSNLTIVTAFLSNVNNRIDRNTDKYIEYGNKLLNIKIPKIVFIDKYLIHNFENSEYNLFIPYDIKDIYLFNLKDKINFDIITPNPNKDTLEYIMVTCNKTEWMKIAITYNKFNTEQFLWIDFAIYHLYENFTLDKFENDIYKLKSKNFDKIRIPHIWDLNKIYYNNNIKKNIAWYFAGGMFGGNKDYLIKFADLMKEYCLKLINYENILIWEVNIWYLIYKENSDLFDYYYGDHNTYMIENYSK